MPPNSARFQEMHAPCRPRAGMFFFNKTPQLVRTQLGGIFKMPPNKLISKTSVSPVVEQYYL